MAINLIHHQCLVSDTELMSNLNSQVHYFKTKHQSTRALSTHRVRAFLIHAFYLSFSCPLSSYLHPRKMFPPNSHDLKILSSIMLCKRVASGDIVPFRRGHLPFNLCACHAFQSGSRIRAQSGEQQLLGLCQGQGKILTFTVVLSRLIRSNR